jgi:hypothetical protein
MDNKAYEKYKAEHKTNTNHTPPEPAEFDPFDDHLSYTEIGLMLVAVLAIIIVFNKIMDKFDKKDTGE